MLVELRVRNLGVIEDETIVFGPGLSALTGETGAGKTLLVDAIVLLAGGASDPALVRPGAQETLVEGRFVRRTASGGDSGGDRQRDRQGNDDEVVVSRVVPSAGRSRCYVDGRMVSAASLGEVVRELVEINGQHGFHYLLSAQVQRDILDQAGQVDTGPSRALRREITRLRGVLADLGGDPTSRARQVDLLRYQLVEIDRMEIEDPDEEAALLAEQETLADATGTIEAAQRIHEVLAGDGGSIEGIGAAIALANGRPALSELRVRLDALQDEVADCAGRARRVAESLEADPGRLAQVGERLAKLGDLRRKYGATLSEVLNYAEDVRSQIDELASHDETIRLHQELLAKAEADLREADRRVLEARRSIAPELGRAVEAELAALALPRARFNVEVSETGDGTPVTWMFAANPGQALMPLAKVASGGELARVMLATRIAIGRALRSTSAAAGGSGAGPPSPPIVEDNGPETLVFDEVDAGVGGEAAAAVGGALAELSKDRQVLVVTHLAQVAAFADLQVAVVKHVVETPEGEQAVARASAVEDQQRVVELARMLSGQPDSPSARLHAEDLLHSKRRSPH